MEITTFKVKSCNLQMSTFVYSNFHISSYSSPIDANPIFSIQDSKPYKTLQISAQNNVIWMRYEFYKGQLNSANLRRDYFVK